MRTRLPLHKAMAAGALLVGLAGCAVGEQGAREQEREVPAAESLFDVQIPSDFTFATSRPLNIHAAGEPAVIARTYAEIRLANGEVIHRGPLNSTIELAIPVAANELEVTLRTSGNERVVQVPFEGSDAVIPVE